MKVVNKKAFYDYQILQRLEAGIVLSGGEVKSIRAGRVQLSGAFVKLIRGEVWLINAKIPEYEFAKVKGYKLDKTRKLLLSKKQILHLGQKVQTKGVTLVPLSVYTKRGLVKVEIGLVKGKKLFEKREAKKKRDLDRDVERELLGN